MTFLQETFHKPIIERWRLHYLATLPKKNFNALLVKNGWLNPLVWPSELVAFIVSAHLNIARKD